MNCCLISLHGILDKEENETTDMFSTKECCDYQDLIKKEVLRKTEPKSTLILKHQ